MPRKVEKLEVAGCYVTPGDRAGWVRTGDTTAVPTRLSAVVVLNEPAVQVHLAVVVRDGGRAEVRELALAPSDGLTPILSSTLRRIPVDALLKVVLGRAAVTVKPRPEVDARAFQVPGEPDSTAWVSSHPVPQGRGRKVARDRVARAAEIYLEALAAGSKAPAEVVAAEMGYSRATAARDIRAARARKPPLLGPPGEALTPSEPSNGAEAIVSTGRITRMPMAEFISAREQIERDLGMAQSDQPEVQ